MGNQEKEKRHKCPYPGCNSAFYRPYRLDQHLLVHNNVKAFCCPEVNCTKSYSSKSHMIRHKNTTHKKKQDTEVVHRCSKCMKKYANRQNLKRHLRIHHKIHKTEHDFKVWLICDHCGVEFRKKHQLTTHMFTHTGVKAFNCESCPKSFVSLIEKKKHMRCHKTYHCSQCGLSFDRWSKYIKHSQSEHAQKEFICDACERVFKKRQFIVRHMKIHDEKRQFHCTYENCKKFYSRNSNLRQHILMKHERVTHDCLICNAQLSTKKKLEEHILSRHEGGSRIKTHKTKKQGRKARKDAGCLKTSTAILISGLPKDTVIINLQPKYPENPPENFVH